MLSIVAHGALAQERAEPSEPPPRAVEVDPAYTAAPASAAAPARAPASPATINALQTAAQAAMLASGAVVPGFTAPVRKTASSSAAPTYASVGVTAPAMRTVLGLTVLAILPALLVCVTSFLRIIIVLSMLRQGIGMMETPPNTVLIGLALFLTLFTMSPVLQEVNTHAFTPFMAGQQTMEQAYQNGSAPLREFMVRQTREQDLALMVELSHAPTPHSMDDISNVQLVPAFMLSELRAAFQIGFVILLPFLLIDLVVSSVLMALGMMMMPPTTVALPIKVLMFVLVDGWTLVLKGLVGSFH